jgi:hypothetical protein
MALPVLPNRIRHGILTVTAVSVSMCVTHDVRMHKIFVILHEKVNTSFYYCPVSARSYVLLI